MLLSKWNETCSIKDGSASNVNILSEPNDMFRYRKNFVFKASSRNLHFGNYLRNAPRKTRNVILILRSWHGFIYIPLTRRTDPQL